MNEQNNNQDDWSNRNWQDASKFNNDNYNNQGLGRSLFGSAFTGQGYNNPPSGKIGGGWMRTRNPASIIIAVLVIVIIYTLYTQTSINSNVTKSTIERTKIETSTFNPTTDEFYFDEYGAVDDDRALASAAQYFFNKTGVVPFVYFSTSDEEVQSETLSGKAETYYKENFNDEDHFMICIGTNNSSYTLGTFIGENAKTVLDDEALQIFKDYLDKYYSARQTNNQTYVVNTYRYAADRMMTTLPFSVKNVVIGGIAIIVLIIVLVYYIKKRSSQEPSDENSEMQNFS